MALGSERYQTPQIYICEEKYRPKGICYGETCSPKSISVKESDITNTVKVYVNGVLMSDTTTITGRRVDISVYIAPESFDTQNLTAYLLQSDAAEDCILAYPPCRDFDIEAAVKWVRSGDNIISVLPLAEHCSVDRFKTVYSDTTRFTSPASIGKADGKKATLTFDNGGITYHSTSLSDNFLVPGKQAFVSYGLRDVEGYFPLATIDFHTSIFTSAVFLGCGLVKKHKLYKDPIHPDEGYTYVFKPYEGGEGSIFQPEWTYSKDYRCLVEYKSQKYWLKSTDFAAWKLGDIVFIAKSLSSLPLIPDPEINQGCADETLYEPSDTIIPEFFYKVK